MTERGNGLTKRQGKNETGKRTNEKEEEQEKTKEKHEKEKGLMERTS